MNALHRVQNHPVHSGVTPDRVSQLVRSLSLESQLSGRSCSGCLSVCSFRRTPHIDEHSHVIPNPGALQVLEGGRSWRALTLDSDSRIVDLS